MNKTNTKLIKTYSYLMESRVCLIIEEFKTNFHNTTIIKTLYGNKIQHFYKRELTHRWTTLTLKEFNFIKYYK